MESRLRSRRSRHGGALLGPRLLKPGYTKGYTCATIAVGALITATIPPSSGSSSTDSGAMYRRAIVRRRHPPACDTVFLMLTAWVLRATRLQPAADRLPTALKWYPYLECKWPLLFRSSSFSAPLRHLRRRKPAHSGRYAICMGFIRRSRAHGHKLMESLRQSMLDTEIMLISCRGNDGT